MHFKKKMYLFNVANRFIKQFIIFSCRSEVLTHKVMLSFEQLIQNLTDTMQSSSVRREAAANLAVRGDAQAVPFLIEALTDSDSIVRREAAKALQQLNAASATKPLLHALETEANDLTAWAIIEAVGELGTPNVLPMLKSFQKDDSLLTQMEVKKSIARIETRYPDRDNGANTEQKIEAEEFELGVDRKHSSPYITGPDEDQSDAPSLEQPDTTQPNLEVGDEVGSISVEATWRLDAAEPEEITIGEHQARYLEVGDTEASISVGATGGPDAAEPEEITIGEHQAQLAAESTETVNGVELTETVSPEAEFTPDELKEEAELKDLSEAIAQSSRRGEHRTTLPVLVPSSSAVSCGPIEYETLYEQPRGNFLAPLLHPSQYFSKRWLSRARAYLVLWCVLLAATIGFTRYHGRSESEAATLARLRLSVADVPEQVKRSLNEGDFYIQEGYYRQAISSYQLGRSLAAIPAHFYKKLGFAYFKEHQYALAVEAYELFLESQANATNDPFVAEATFAGSYQPSLIGKTTGLDYEAYNALGTAYMKLRRMKDAQRAYEQAIALAPEDGQAYNNLAQLYADGYQQRLRFAEVLAYIAVALNPEIAPYQTTLGQILGRRGQLNKAIKSLERAIRLQNDYIEAHYHLAQVALKANERNKAFQAIQHVIRLNPTFVLMNSRL